LKVVVVPSNERPTATKVVAGSTTARNVSSKPRLDLVEKEFLECVL
jgi:hypothetical protein